MRLRGGGTHLLVGGASLLALLILGAMIFPALPQTAQAEEATSKVKLTVNPVISISLQNALNVDVLPTEDGAFNSNTAALSISTNNETGYSLYMATGNGENTLTSQNPGTSNVISAVNGGDSGVTSANFTNNTWGYNLSQDSVSDTTTYKAVPTATGDTAIISTSSPTEADTYNLTFGTKVDTSLPSGTYSNDVVVSVVANPAFVPVFDGIQTMQEMTSTICADAAENDTAQLTDTRDGKKYWVTKLADGRCWMVQNLDLDLKTTIPLTPSSSDVFAEWTPVVDTSTTIFNNADNDGTYSYDPGTSASDAHLSTGNYYQYNAATAGSGAAVAGQEAPSSICPKGWTLPSTNEFSILFTSYGFTYVDGRPLLGIPMEQPPLYWTSRGYLRTGDPDDPGGPTPGPSSTSNEPTSELSDLLDGEIRNESAAYYWTDSGSWLQISYNALPVDPGDTWGLHSGMTVRCLAQ